MSIPIFSSVRKKIEKNFWDMEIIGNRRKILFLTQKMQENENTHLERISLHCDLRKWAKLRKTPRVYWLMNNLVPEPSNVLSFRDILKVSKSRKQIWKFSFEPKITQKIWRISALRVFTVHRAEILQFSWVIFWKNWRFNKCNINIFFFKKTNISKIKIKQQFC